MVWQQLRMKLNETVLSDVVLRRALFSIVKSVWKTGKKEKGKSEQLWQMVKQKTIYFPFLWWWYVTFEGSCPRQHNFILSSFVGHTNSAGQTSLGQEEGIYN